MNIEKRVNGIIESTIKDLLNGKYRLITKGEHNSILKYGKNTLSIWIPNGADYCKIDARVNGFEFPEFKTMEIKKAVYKLATTETDYMIKQELRKANKARKESLLKHRENLRLIESLRDKLKTFEK